VERETDKRHHGLEKGGVEMGVGDRLKQSRELKGLSQGKIEERSGLFRCYISRVSAVLDWCKRTAGKYRWFAGSIADQLRMVGRENQFEVARVMNISHPLHVDFDGQRVELRELVSDKENAIVLGWILDAFDVHTLHQVRLPSLSLG
jgi:hypothetical protein